MIISRTSLSPARIGLKVCMLLLAWVVLAGLSWADLLDLHDMAVGPSADLQQATEPDLNELREDVTTQRVIGDYFRESLTAHLAVLFLPPFSSQTVGSPPQGLRSKLSVYRL